MKKINITRIPAILIVFALGVIYSSCSSKSYLAYKANKTKNRQWADSLRTVYKYNDSAFKKIAEQIVAGPNDTIADIGGGFGYHSSMMAKYLPKSVVYFEEDVNLKWCNKKEFKKTFKFYNSTANIDNFRFFIGDSISIPFPDNFFKTITLFISIHEFQNKELMMKEINRILKHNGKLYILEAVYKKTPQNDPVCKIPYLSESDLNHLIIKTGFTAIADKNINKDDSTSNTHAVFLECSKRVN